MTSAPSQATLEPMRTVRGVPLRDGERVIFYRQRGLNELKRYFWWIVIACVASAIVDFVRNPENNFGRIVTLLVGLPFLVMALRMRGKFAAEVVTTERFLQIDHKGVPMSLPLRDAVDLAPMRQNKFYGANPVGLVATAAGAVANKLASLASKNDAAYWRGADRVVLTTAAGARFEMFTEHPEELGPFATRCLAEPGFAAAAAAVGHPS